MRFAPRLPLVLVAVLALCLPAASAADADLSVLKSGAPDPVAQGSDLTYTLTVVNDGPDDALTVTLNDAVPVGTTFQSLASPAGWSCATPAVGGTGDVICTIATFPPGSAVFTLVVNVDASVPAGFVIVNSANVFSSTPDPNAENDSTSVLTGVSAPTTPVISATKTVAGQFFPGGLITYTVVLSNTGTGNQGNNPGNELADTLPAELILASASASSGTAVATVATNTVTWNGTIPAGGSVTITIQATVDPDVPPGTPVSNQAFFSFDADGSGSNETPGASNPAVFTVLPLPLADIPALDDLGLGLLAALLALGGLFLLRGR